MITKIKDNKDIKFEQPSDFLLFFNRYVMVAVAIIVLSVLVLGYLFLLTPKIKSIKATTEQTDITQADKLLNEKLLSRIKELDNKYKEIKTQRQNDLLALTTMIPTGQQMAEIFVLADRLAKKHGFEVKSIDIVDNAQTTEKATATPPNFLPPEATTSSPSILSINAIVNQPFELPQQVSEETQSLKHDLNTRQGIEQYLLTRTDLKSLTIHLVLSLAAGGGNSPLDRTSSLGQPQTSYETFKEYLNELENNLRLMDIQAVGFDSLDEVQASQEKENTATAKTFTIDLKTYYKS
jgi:hypothetical protein